MSMNTIPSSFALTRTSLIVNRVPRSRTVSPDLMCFAFSIIFILPSLSPFPAGYAEEENQNQSEAKNNQLDVACLDLQRNSIDTSTVSWVELARKKRSGQPVMNRSKQGPVWVRQLLSFYSSVWVSVSAVSLTPSNRQR